MIYFDHNFTDKCMSTLSYLTTGMCNIFFGGRGFAEHHFSRCGQLVKKLITIEPNRVIHVFDYLYIFRIVRENDKEKKTSYIEKILIKPGFDSLCARLLDFKRASYTTWPPHMIYVLEQFTHITFTFTRQIKICMAIGSALYFTTLG